MVGVGLLGYQLNFGEAGRRISSRMFESILIRETEKSPHNPDLFRILGDIYYANSDFANAAHSYEKAAALDPRNSTVLNNLAWLYATCEDERYQNPEKALELAQRAAALDQSPHILDTLAESWYRNGRYPEAMEAGRRALEAAGKNRTYYANQLKKFEEKAAEAAAK